MISRSAESVVCCSRGPQLDRDRPQGRPRAPAALPVSARRVLFCVLFPHAVQGSDSKAAAARCRSLPQHEKGFHGHDSLTAMLAFTSPSARREQFTRPAAPPATARHRGFKSPGDVLESSLLFFFRHGLRDFSFSRFCFCAGAACALIMIPSRPGNCCR